jgi:glycosyltransferase involved in cell wall biosynthesis
MCVSQLEKPRIAAIVENPIQFFVPHYRHIAEDGRLDLTVFYLTDRGVKPFSFHKATVIHEQSVFEGYKWKMLRNKSPFKNSFGFLDNFDPELYSELKKGSFSAAWFHGYNYASMWIGFSACIRAHIPILLRGESENFFPRSLLIRLTKRIVLGYLFNRVGAFLYIGKCNREFYKSFNIPDEKLFYVPYGVENEWFQATFEERENWRKEIRRYLSLNDETIIFIYTSKHRNPKRPFDAVESFCRLPPELNAALIMLGDGELRPEAESIFHKLNRGHRVFFLGLQPYSELRRYLATADVHVFPSVENWGMAINEALAAGLAIVTTDQVAGWFDMVTPGVNGFIYRAGCIPELTTHMLTLSTNPSLIVSMKEASLKRASTLSFKQMTEGLVQAVNYVINNSVK